jgi:hypothetical protein
VVDPRKQFDLPRAGIWILKAVLSEEEAGNVLGCLEEIYREKVRETGSKESLWCWGQIGRSAFFLFWEAMASGQLIDRLHGLKREMPFGHLVLTVCLYAALYVIALLVEISYAFDRFGHTFLRLAPLIFLWMASTSFLGLCLDIILIRRKRLGRGLFLAMFVFTASAVTLLVALRFYLPQTPVIDATVQTLGAYDSFLKSTTTLFLPLAIFFVVCPFHSVVSKQMELQTGARRISDPPQGWVIEIRPLVLATLIIVSALFFLISSSYLIDHLKPGPYSNLFFQLFMSRFCVFYALGIEALWWYWVMLKKIRLRDAIH